MNEFKHTDNQELNKPKAEGFKNIKPENGMTKDKAKEIYNQGFKENIVEKVNEKIEGQTLDSDRSLGRLEYMIMSEERKEFANRSDGKWSGEPGNSIFFPKKIEARDALRSYNQSGIEYRDGEPDFSKVSEATIQIENMTSNRHANFVKADNECAKQWNEHCKDGRTDWKARDVKEWRQANRYSWHERLDMKTMDLVQRDIHEECKHYGGVSQCKRHENYNGGGFDE